MAHKNISNWSPYTARKKSKSGAGVIFNYPGTLAKKNSTLAQTLEEKPKAENFANAGRHRRPSETFSFEEINSRLQDIFKNHQFGHITHEQRKQLAQFYLLLMEKQKVLNITRLVTLRETAIKHFIDCLIIPRLVKLEFPLLDLGSGAGFPGIPLKILFSEEKIVLTEGVQKRVDFLKSVRESLDLKYLDIIGRNVKADFFYPTQSVISRAVEDISNTLYNVGSCLKMGGCVYFMKGPGVDPEIERAKDLKEFYSLELDQAYVLPGTPQNRRLLVYRKIKQLPIPEL